MLGVIVGIIMLLSGCSGKELIVTEKAAYYLEDSLAAPAEFKSLDSYDLDTLGRRLGDAMEFLPEPVDLVNPDFPREKMMHSSYYQDGTVLVKVFISTEGKVLRALVWKSSNNVFNKPCLEAAMESEFTPGRLSGKTVKCWMTIPFTFHVILSE